VVLDPKDDQQKFVNDGKKDDATRVITTYISMEIHFDTSGIRLFECCLEGVEDSI
jgi:hypothetical protein